MLSYEAANVPVLTAGALVKEVRETFRGLPDARQGGNNQRYTLECQ